MRAHFFAGFTIREKRALLRIGHLKIAGAS